MSSACSLEIIHDGTWNQGDQTEQGTMKRLNQDSEVPCSHLPCVWGKNHQSPGTFLSLSTNDGFVFICTFHRLNDLCKGEKMNFLPEAGVGARRPTPPRPFSSPLAYHFLSSLALPLILCWGVRGWGRVGWSGP